MVNTLVINTNEEINSKRNKYSEQNSATIKETISCEISALLGLLVLTAALKDNHVNSLELFDSTYSGTRYVSAMSRDRFDFLLNCLRFDEKILVLNAAQKINLPQSEIYENSLFRHAGTIIVLAHMLILTSNF